MRAYIKADIKKGKKYYALWHDNRDEKTEKITPQYLCRISKRLLAGHQESDVIEDIKDVLKIRNLTVGMIENWGALENEILKLYQSRPHKRPFIAKHSRKLWEDRSKYINLLLYDGRIVRILKTDYLKERINWLILTLITNYSNEEISYREFLKRRKKIERYVKKLGDQNLVNGLKNLEKEGKEINKYLKIPEDERKRLARQGLERLRKATAEKQGKTYDPIEFRKNEKKKWDDWQKLQKLIKDKSEKEQKWWNIKYFEYSTLLTTDKQREEFLEDMRALMRGEKV